MKHHVVWIIYLIFCQNLKVLKAISQSMPYLLNIFLAPTGAQGVKMYVSASVWHASNEDSKRIMES